MTRLVVGAVVAAGAACSGPSRPVASPSPPTIAVRGSACVDRQAAELGLREALARAEASNSDLRVVVTATPVTGEAPGTDVELVVERRDGTRGLERTYRLAPQDCASSPGLLALALERFLSAFPIWAVPLPPEPGSPIEVVATGLVGAAVGPTTPSLELAAAADREVWRRNRIGASLSIRGNAPLAVGSGSFQQTVAAAGARWRYAGLRWEPQLELRGGAALVWGFGFDADNDRQLLPWFEAVASVSRRWRQMSVGVWLAVAPVSHRAVTSDRLSSRDLPNVHAGLSATWTLVGKK